MGESLEQVEDGIRKRFKHVVEQFPQREIARRTGFSQANISRYLQDRRMPGVFCLKLEDEFGVNHSWLLTGKGSPFLTDAATETAELAGDMLALTDSMEAVSRMRLGAISGKTHLEVHRKLEQALRNYSTIRSNVQTRISTLLRQIISELDTALRQRNYAQSKRFLQTASGVAALCEDHELQLDLIMRRGVYERTWGTLETSLDHLKQALLRSVAGSDAIDRRTCNVAAEYSTQLTGVFGRTNEVRKTITMLTTFTDVEKILPDWHAYFKLVEGYLDFLEGDIRSALSLIKEYGSDIPEGVREAYLHLYVHPALMAGTMSYRDVRALPYEVVTKAVQLICCGALYEKPEDIKDAATHYVGTQRHQLSSDRLWGRYAIALQSAIVKKRKDAYDNYIESRAANPRIRGIDNLVFSELAQEAHIASLTGHNGKGVSALKKAQKLLDQPTPGVTFSITFRAFHARNALRLIPKSTRSKSLLSVRSQAEEFIQAHILRGFGSFSALVQG